MAALEAGPVEGPARNRVIGNYIGTHTNGLFAIPNVGPGVWLTNATANVIGGLSASERNLISGNATDGVILESASSNSVVGNYIGTDVNGGLPLGNLNGVTVLNGSFNFIGSPTSIGNVIGGNG